MRHRLALVPLLLSACSTVPAVSSGIKLDPDTRPACAANCEAMGLRLAAVVLVRNSAGCVCAVPETKIGKDLGGEAARGALAVTGGVMIVDDDTSQRQLEQVEQMQQQQFQPVHQITPAPVALP
jgi:hypothetical protein